MRSRAPIGVFDESVTLRSEHLLLVPLSIEDANELVSVLADERLHEYIGGRPANLEELRTHYATLVAGSGNPAEIWLNWVVRRRVDDRAIGVVQATVSERGRHWVALVAWVIGVPWQGQGHGSEAAQELVRWLHERNVKEITAHIHPRHQASAAVAARAGLLKSDEQMDGEQVWRV